ncbi:hypothetical protein CBR_g63122 [Chara braunii]|uniref:Uncharacterized protein n=1 Tax=Chara braunii TaxID=69332 RepID=A0A388K942_CHABU|nr:hypothetical protein CBR_g63122 [Chara braunii]|eukprot:GBG66539.1 hypothetical protein CBR_g63122 [Chara braunii]
MCGLHNRRHVCNPIIQRETTRVRVHLGRSKEVRGNTRVIAEVAIGRRHPRGWRDGMVVGYLRVGKMKIPLLVVTNNLLKNISKSPVRDLGLTISLRMVRRGEAELSAVYLVESSPKSAGKARVTVRYDAQRSAVYRASSSASASAPDGGVDSTDGGGMEVEMGAMEIEGGSGSRGMSSASGQGGS